jgi:Protein of unknown function (DUF5132)
MAFFEDLFKGGNIVTGLAVGVGAAVVAPLVAPAVTNLLRPAAKAVIKGGIMVYDRGREAMAQVGEATSDMVAEVRADTQHADGAAAASEASEPEAHPA